MQTQKLEFGTAHWLNIFDPSREDLLKIAAEYSIDPLVAEESLDPGHLPSLQIFDDKYFLILRSYDEKSAADALDVRSMTRKVAAFWGDGFLVTIQRSESAWVKKLYSNWEKKNARSAKLMAQLLFELVEESIYTYEAPIDEAGLEIEKLEEKIFQGNRSGLVTSDEILETAYWAKKRAALFKRLLRLTRDLLPGIAKIGHANSPLLQTLKEEADRLFYYADDLVETSSDLVQLSISITSNRTNEIVRVLTIISLFLMPLNLITGIYGMNFEFMPELKHSLGYPAILFLMIGIELVIYFFLKKRKWIL